MKTIMLFSLILLGSQSFADPAMIEINEIAKKYKLEQLKKSNIIKPIVYGVGAAGISFDTTFEEAKSLLTPPAKESLADGFTFYNEQLFVLWGPKVTKDSTPQMIVPTLAYLGTMSTNTFGELSYQTKFIDYMENNGGNGAIDLIQDLYNDLENVTDPSYRCLDLGTCRLIQGDVNQANLVMVFPGAVFLLSKEEFQLIEIRIVKVQ